MAIKPILFNTEMVRAILDGRKNCTRRIVKPQPTNEIQCPLGICTDGDKSEIGKFAFGSHEGGGKMIFCKPPYQPGDILYVRETWRVGAWDILNQMIAFDYKDGTCGELTYIHDRELFERLVNQSRNDARQAKCEYNGVDFVWEKGKSPCRWHPSIRMPKEATRIWLKVTDARVERLQEITESGAKAEGIRGYTKDGNLYKYAVTDDWWIDYHNKHKEIVTGTWWQDMPRTAKDAFSYLWNSTIKKSDLDLYGWNANPWVWTIEYERCEKPEGV